VIDIFLERNGIGISPTTTRIIVAIKTKRDDPGYASGETTEYGFYEIF